ncbi:MAG: SprT-like domain-containing protein [SAR324 cluster bacterium]|nr:SprT-like domain-containing protein [SAR324 cluster bacterium]
MGFDQKLGKSGTVFEERLPFTEQSSENKQKVVRQEAQYLMQKHGLTEQGWRFQFDHAKRRAGQCRYDTKTISVSKYFAEKAPAAEIIDTILHEIAHALTPKRGHDRVWQQVALSIGCNGKRCHSLKFAESKYIQQCVNQCWQREVHRRRKNLICRFCRGKIFYTRVNPSQ